jgi:hypothetical protein
MSSRNIKGSGSASGNKSYMVAITLSPAKILPNKRKEKETSFVISFTNSKMPTNKNMGKILNVINLVK